MSVIIENMYMPNKCKECRFEERTYYAYECRMIDAWCELYGPTINYTDYIRETGRLPLCPLREFEQEIDK